MRRFIKILHELGTVGLMGGALAIVILIVRGQGVDSAEYAVVRRAIHDIARMVVVPSVGLVLFTGVLAIGVHPPFHNAGWAWVKAALGVSVLEGTLGGIAGTAREAASISAEVARGTAEPARMAGALRHEWGVLWLILLVSLVNIVLGVWRPKLTRRSRRDASQPPAESS